MKAAILAIVLVGSAAAAETHSQGQARSRADPDRVVCRKIHEIGSRLAIRRVCMTQAQWDEERRQARQNIDRAQVTRSMPGE